jgi:hypothetical protein
MFEFILHRLSLGLKAMDANFSYTENDLFRSLKSGQISDDP